MNATVGAIYLIIQMIISHETVDNFNWCNLLVDEIIRKYQDLVSFSLNKTFDNGDTWLHWYAKNYNLFIQCDNLACKEFYKNFHSTKYKYFRQEYNFDGLLPVHIVWNNIDKKHDFPVGLTWSNGDYPDYLSSPTLKPIINCII